MSESERGKKTRLLFLCTGNSCRSQMAEGFARALRGDSLEPFSAGIISYGLNPLAVKVMAEAGVDISGQRSKEIDEFAAVPLDRVITLCDHAAQRCPIFPKPTLVFHVPFDDPPTLAREMEMDTEQSLALYRRVRDEIRAFVEKMPAVLFELENARRQQAKRSWFGLPPRRL